jgi:hypothetical protein
MTTTVEVLFFEGCPNHRPAMELAKDVVARVAPHALIEEVEVRDNEEAARLRFLGSPTIHLERINLTVPFDGFLAAEVLSSVPVSEVDPIRGRLSLRGLRPMYP